MFQNRCGILQLSALTVCLVNFVGTQQAQLTIIQTIIQHANFKLKNKTSENNPD